MNAVAKVEIGNVSFELVSTGLKRYCVIKDGAGKLIQVLDDEQINRVHCRIMFPWRYGTTMNGVKV